MRHASILLFALLRLTLAKDLAHTPTSRSTNDTALDARGIPLVDGIVHTATNLAAQLQVGACVRLGADFNFAAGTQNQEGVTEIKLKKNACICVDVNAYAGVLDASAGVDVVAQVKGQESVHLRGDVALTLARSIQLPALYPGARAKFNLNIDPLSVCLSASAMLGHSEHYFRPRSEGDCCMRRCADGYIEKNGRCEPGCPPGFKLRPNGRCKPDCKDNQIECGDVCLPKKTHTCQSGVPVPLRKRGLASNQQCGHGLTLCPVPWGTGYECLDTRNDIESCGGCLSNPNSPNNVGVDCTALLNTNSVSCSRGICRVHSCQRGFAPNTNGTACEVARGRKPHLRIQAGDH